jgi:uncharacterized protein (DUF608 family)
MAKKLRQSEALGDGCQDGYQSEGKRVMTFQNGEMGAINGISADGQALHENEQVEEVWTGTTFAIASHMLSEGMREQAFHTASGVYNVVWKDRGGTSSAHRKPTMPTKCIAQACI